MTQDTAAPAVVVRLQDVALRYGKTEALRGITLDIPAGRMIGMIGPDGVGKSSLLSLAAGARAVQQGRVEVLGGDMADKAHRDAVCPRIAYMPQGLGKNLYPTLSVEENLQFFARLFGHDAAERRRRIDDLTGSTDLQKFLQRPAGKLSGGMKQKLGLCCALIHDPDLLILDEPTTGVDPLARAQFWDLIASIRRDRPGMSVIVATAYMDEAQRFDWLMMMDDGRLLATGTPAELLARTRTDSLEAAFIQLLPDEKKSGYAPVEIPPLSADSENDIAIEAKDLSMRFGDFVAVDKVSFRIRRGEIFGFLGSNGCGKSTTMKMLTGLLPATEGQALLFGKVADPRDIGIRRRVGYMSQAFSLYSELSVRQNLVLHAQLFHVPPADVAARLEEMIERFGLREVLDSDTPAALVKKRGAATLEEAFIGYLVEAGGGADPAKVKAKAKAKAKDQGADAPAAAPAPQAAGTHAPARRGRFSPQRMASYMWREALELQRDPIRATLALVGSMILMLVMGFGISLDVEDLRYAILDHDQSTISQSYSLNLAGSRYFLEQPPIVDYADLDRRMRSGELSLAIEIPPGFGRDVLRGQAVQIGAWVDGAMPTRAETVQGYVQGMHQGWLAAQARERLGTRAASLVGVETRFRYNPDVKSLPAMVPAVIPLLLLMLPSMLTALSVVREKELGSIVNLYVTPVTRTEFLIGKQLPYVGLAMINFLLMSLLAVTVFDVPVSGSYPTLLLAALIFCFIATGMGLLASAITNSQIAAMFFAVLMTIIPAIQFAGLINPVSSLEGTGRVIANLYPASHMFTISRGVFNKALGLGDLYASFWPMLLAVPVIIGSAIALLKKQDT